MTGKFHILTKNIGDKVTDDSNNEIFFFGKEKQIHLIPRDLLNTIKKKGLFESPLIE